MLVLILDYLSDHDILRSVARVNRHMYRLGHDNSLWKRRMHRFYPVSAYAYRFAHTTSLPSHSVAPSAFGAQDLSVNWFGRYVSEARSVRSLNSPNRLTSR